jgi:adenine-specific DNA-methyltransferase
MSQFGKKFEPVLPRPERGKDPMPDRQPVARESANLADEQREKLQELFPEVFSEGRIDFEKLRATLGDFVDDRPERYTFNWAGKRDAIRLLQMPTRATLVPDREESVNFDDTQHIFIEGCHEPS